MSTETVPPPQKTASPGQPSPTAGKSALGGPQGIASNLEAFLNKGAAPEKKEVKEPEKKVEQSAKTEKVENPADQKKGEEKKVEEKKPEDTFKLPIEERTKKKPEEKKTEDVKLGSDGMTAEARKTFLQMKENHDKATKQLQELQAKLGDLDLTKREKDELKSRIKELEERDAKNSAIVAAHDIRQTERYQLEVAGPMEKLVLPKFAERDAKGRIKTDSQGRPIIGGEGELHRVCKFLGVDPQKALDAITSDNEFEGDGELQVLLEPIKDDLKKSAVIPHLMRVAGAIRELTAKADAIEREAPAALEAIRLQERTRKEAEEQERSQQYTRGFDAVWQKMRENIPFLVKHDKDGKPTDELTEAGEFVLEKAKSVDVKNLRPDMLAYFVQAGYANLKYADEIERLQEELDRTRDELKKFSRSPDRERGSPRGDKDITPKGDKYQSPSEAFASRFGS